MLVKVTSRSAVAFRYPVLDLVAQQARTVTLYYVMLGNVILCYIVLLTYIYLSTHICVLTYGVLTSEHRKNTVLFGYVEITSVSITRGNKLLHLLGTKRTRGFCKIS